MFPDRWTPEAIVLGAGDYPDHPVPRRMLEEARRIVCCDGAAEAYIRHSGRMPWRIVGDGDSLPATLREQCRDIFIHETEQETNDQTKATRLLLRQGVRRVAYLGATGKREDHTIGNIALLPTYRRMGLDVRMYTDHGVFLLPTQGRLSFQAEPGTPVSVWNFGATALHAEGLEYALYDFDQLWQGTLNRMIQPCCTIEGKGDFLVFLGYC